MQTAYVPQTQNSSIFHLHVLKNFNTFIVYAGTHIVLSLEVMQTAYIPQTENCKDDILMIYDSKFYI